MGSATAHPSQVAKGELRLGHEDEVDSPHLAGRRQEHAEEVVEPASRQVYSVNSTGCRGNRCAAQPLHQASQLEVPTWTLEQPQPLKHAHLSPLSSLFVHTKAGRERPNIRPHGTP